jgi:hypothetical protein
MNTLTSALVSGLVCTSVFAAGAHPEDQAIADRLAHVRNCVVSIARVDTGGGAAKILSTHGTAFFIGDSGYALTAKHVIAGKHKPLAALTMATEGGWTWVNIVASEMHPTEDVAILKLDRGSCKAGFQLSNSVEMASSRYRIYGYPGDATRLETANGEFPDLIYTEGYIRRRYSASLHAPAASLPPTGTVQISGTSFFELSQVAGPGTSGAPVFAHAEPIEVIGIYSAEKHTPSIVGAGDNPITHLTSVSYAIRDDAFRDWKPTMLGGRTVLDESKRRAKSSE